MKTYDNDTLNHFRSLLNLNDNGGFTEDFENDMTDHGIPEGRAAERLLYICLSNEIQTWFNKNIQDTYKPYIFLYLYDMIHLVKELRIVNFVPWLLKILNTNKHTVIKKILTEVRSVNLSKEDYINILQQIKEIGIDWPEIDVVVNGLKYQLTK